MSILTPRSWIGALDPPVLTVRAAVMDGAVTKDREAFGPSLGNPPRTAGADFSRHDRDLLELIGAMLTRTLNGAADPAEAREAVARLVTALGEARAPDAFGDTDLGALARDVLAVFETGADGCLGFDGPSLTLTGDAARIVAHALFELAADAIQRGALVHADGRVTVSWVREAGGLLLLWQEHGLGAAERDGAGVPTRRIADILSGALTFEHAPTGLRAEFRLPPRCLRPAAAGVRALVVEDSPLIAADLADILAEEGIEATIAASLAEARAALALCGFDFTLLDVTLVDGSSDCLLELLDPDRVVVISGHAPGTLPAAFAGLPLLAKPFALADIIATCRRYTAIASGQSMR